VQLIAEGYSNESMADMLGLALKTIEALGWPCVVGSIYAPQRISCGTPSATCLSSRKAIGFGPPTLPLMPAEAMHELDF
jgi:hypothetical protein